jgi:hypothetical protein
MSEKQCPAEAELLRFVDGDLSPETSDRIAEHLASCASCADEVSTLRELVEDVHAPVAGASLDVDRYVADVMARLDTPASIPRDTARRWPWLAGGVALAASVALLVGLRGPEEEAHGRFTARGGRTEASTARDVGVQLYAKGPELRPVQAGEKIGAGTPLTAGLRNLGKDGVYLLLFAIDARNEVHWIAPEYTVEGEDPEAVKIVPSPGERLLPSAAAFDDLSPGPLRVVALIDPKPMRVSAVESLPAAELDGAGLVRRFPAAEVRQFQLDVVR